MMALRSVGGIRPNRKQAAGMKLVAVNHRWLNRERANDGSR